MAGLAAPVVIGPRCQETGYQAGNDSLPGSQGLALSKTLYPTSESTRNGLFNALPPFRQFIYRLQDHSIRRPFASADRARCCRNSKRSSRRIMVSKLRCSAGTRKTIGRHQPAWFPARLRRTPGTLIRFSALRSTLNRPRRFQQIKDGQGKHCDQRRVEKFCTPGIGPQGIQHQQNGDRRQH